jgi:death-on-curing protein
MNEPVWLSRDLVQRIHDRQLLEHGGTPGLRDEGLLESALARPRQKWAYSEPAADLPALAAAHAGGISRNHPFLDGNKRTAAVACELFLELNGYVLLAEDADLYPLFLGLAAGEIDEDELAAWLRDHTRPDRVSEPAAAYD